MPGFIGFFALARRLLINMQEMSAAIGGVVGVLPCYLL
jgi:hypothetical protein